MTKKPIRLLYAFAVLLPLSGGAGAQSFQPLGCLIEPHRVVELGSPVIGVIESMEVERGDRVRKGQVIATLRADVERAAVRGADVGHLALADLRAAGRIADLALETAPQEGFTVDVALAP